ncbi:MAG: hypothetical protein CV089_03005 [Nitrospira sp. WS110]|nr:hypothetical protein [Nitrospira sp. WS110]
MRGLVAKIATQYKRHAEVLNGSRVFVILLCFGLVVTLGCTSVRTPMEPGSTGSLESDEGLVLGRIQLMGSSGEQFASPDQPFRSPFHIQWRLKEASLGKEFVIDRLPREGPFALKLPTGAYQLTAVSFDTALGIWQASLPTSFTVSPQGCTYLGTWELRMQAGFFDGSVSRQVIDQRSVAESDLKTFVDDGLWPPMVAQLGPAAESPLILTFRTQGTELTSPP